ncbi:MAG TPA: DUF4079 family protein [Deltaproteobacteria bacterium]|nr:DUF4079 family protein [Deltaproteobacteria bacterium]
MNDPTILRMLAFAHPAWMLVGIGTAIAAARHGLEIRRRRLAGRPPGRALRDRHLRLGKRAIVMIGIGFVAGPISMLLLRDRAAFDSFHGVLGVIGLGLFAWTGWSGRSLAGGNHEARDIHRIAAASSVATAMLSAVAGFILLP